MAKAKRIKAPAADALQSRDEVAVCIKKIGDLQRESLRSQTIMNDKIAEITEVHQPGITTNEAKIKALFAQVQAWCETNRADLTDDYKVKSVNLITGDIGWRADPPSVALRDKAAAVDSVRDIGLDTYIRTTAEINKDAILNDRALLAGKEDSDEKTAAMERLAKLAGVAGITIRSGVEKFFVTPFEQTA